MSKPKRGVQWMHFEGTHFDVGYKLGQYWATRIKDLGKTSEGVKFLKKYNYFKWLNKKWENEHEPLLLYFLEKFPKLVEELSGMVQGVNNSGFEITTTFPALFGLILGEVDEEVFGCSTIACCNGNEAILAHNEEDDIRFPLCFARVRLKDQCGNKEFLSVSHPFQFFGSSVGATPSFAFTGNSIGMNKKRTEIVKKSLHLRVPKTVLSRLMLEKNGTRDVHQLLCTHHSVLPNHWFVVDQKTITSVQLCPLTDVNQSPGSQINWDKIKESIAFHTNHFQNLKYSDKTWTWGKNYNNKSKRRLERLKSLHEHNGCSTAGLRKTLLSLRESNWTMKKTTSATIIFRISSKGIIGNADSYFNKTESVGHAYIRR